MEFAASFFAKLQARVASVGSPLCVGIDPTTDLLEAPFPESALAFSKRLVDETLALTAAYKVNVAFFEALGPRGWEILQQVVSYIKSKDGLVILDAKRGDIGSTADAYATACFQVLQADCVTVSPYMGRDSVAPFLKKFPDSAMFVLCKTSNPGSRDFQELKLADGRFVYESVVDVFSAEFPGRAGFVVGATDLEALNNVRSRAPEAWILAPGLGAQGGSVLPGSSNILYPVSRGIYQGGRYRENAEKFALALRQFLCCVGLWYT